MVGEMDDMQNSENTKLKETIVTVMPTHEPYIRPQAKELTTSDFAVRAASNEGGKSAVLSAEQKAMVKAAFNENQE
jgi:hypothetical protein